ncbi:uncharacterized protein J7T54_008371 [Emericellopsis cladophorae]|uniref:SWR1-complex protein 3 domain-containing protein n=1 Tax=Emericellopsis cladophorae TaxID=2686198 RepID=A0A9Q0BF39_9HYPO|nr:uncharacterized protein J7T54_008371 [Emericellopsis cladophorae]KAI6782285.1 hypothetical protein J7T54_008371 [Emericellopsis cladophorae]
MERKRKLPARAAARVESEAKRRQSTPREKSEEPTPAPVVEEPPTQPSLPRSIQPGKPLPTVEDAQPDDLSIKEYQSISESGVLAESISRSRHKWINDGLFEKYWTKPHKRKGVVNEDPKNPPKESMVKVGTVQITIEPHMIEATMYTVKDPKKPVPPAAQPPNQARPVIQYGPPNGMMPPPRTGTPGAVSPAPEGKLLAPSPAPSNAQPPQRSPSVDQGTRAPASASPAPSYPPRPVAIPASKPTPPTTNTGPTRPPQATTPSAPATPAIIPPLAPNAGPGKDHAPSHTTGGPQPVGVAAPPAAAAPTTSKTVTNDPVIALLAQKAGADDELKDLMRRVAHNQATTAELAKFQGIIDQLNAEYKRGGGQQGPSADRLLVDQRTVRYFADEVCAILDIVLASNPDQRAADLRPPPRSDPLVVLLVKRALEHKPTREMCRRIVAEKPNYTDATDLKTILDRLLQESKTPSRGTPAPAQPKPAAPGPNVAANGYVNGHPQAHGATHPSQQALRSKGPPPAPKQDISAVVFDFGGGDRFLFPKFSILEYIPTPVGQQVIASFLIIRKGSTIEYGGDPALDYYQPVTIRLYAHSGRHLENLARVVAPPAEVRAYMENVMDNMTRAEYILLAMRLPRFTKDEGDSSGNRSEDAKAARGTPLTEKELEKSTVAKPEVLWTTPAAVKSEKSSRAMKSREAEEETQAQYRRLINSIAAKDSAAV